MLHLENDSALHFIKCFEFRPASISIDIHGTEFPEFEQSAFVSDSHLGVENRPRAFNANDQHHQ